jgi:serine/threonine protein kinase
LLAGGRYRILKTIGRGGMGAVYLAEHTRLQGTLLAIKEMSDAQLSPADKAEAVAAFYREAQILANLKHDNIPRVSDSFEENGKEYLVMQYVHGETLEEKLVQNGRPLPEKEVLPWAGQLCDVLHYLHSQTPPIIFRDLKPANIMVDRQGQVKLIDFGIVRFFKPGQAKDTTKFGSPGYAPPEQYGKGQTDARSDVYALAATLHHILTGVNPELNPFQFDPARQLNRQISQTTSDALVKALQKDRAARWPDMPAFRQALLPLAAAKPAVAAKQAAAPAAASQAHRPSPPTIIKPPPPAPAPSPPPSPIKKPQSVGTQGGNPGFVDTNVLGRRLIAHLLDTAFLVLASIAVLFAIEMWRYSMGYYGVGEEIMALLVAGYYTIFHAHWGKTPGKKIAGIHVVCGDGTSIGWGRAFWRTATLLVTLYLGAIACLGIFPYIVPLLSSNQRAAHDYLSGTVVARDW